MAKKIMSGSRAIAEAVALCGPQVIGAYPITPQTIIVEELAKFVADGKLDAEFVNAESEHSAISISIGAQATGVRTFTATSSQGLALMHEMLFIASGMRLPLVMAVSNRALSAPLNIWNDQQDSVSERDAGWIQLYCENAQEAHDTTVQAYRIAEEVSLPAMVCIDGFVVSHTYEPVDMISDADKLDKFLPDYRPRFALDPSVPVTMGAYATPDYYTEFRRQQQEAMVDAAASITRANADFSSLFGRGYGDGMVEKINFGKDTRYVIITMGSLAGTIRTVLRDDMGLLRIRSFRPFPHAAVADACRGMRSVGVIEKDVSVGSDGALHNEVRSALYSPGDRPAVSGFVAGLGGRDIRPEDIERVIGVVKTGRETVEWINTRE